MSRRLVALAAVLLVLAVADGWLRHARGVRRAEASVLRPLVPPQSQVVPERVRRLRIQVPGSAAWIYERRGDAWRFPAYFDAYAHTDRVERLLQVVAGATGTLASTDSDDFDEFRVTEHQAARLSLEGSGDELLAEVWVGRGVPGAGGDESFARRTGSDSVLHVHANPLLLLGGARPPMLDPALLPRAERRGAVVDVRVVPPEGGAYRLRRVAAPLPEDAPPMPMPADDRQRYRWLLERGARVDSCVDGSVYAYLAYLRQVQVEGLVDPRDGAYGFGDARVELTDEHGAADVIDVGRAGAAGEVHVRNRSAGLTSVLTAERGHWLTPPAETMLDSLPQPSPFDSARR